MSGSLRHLPNIISAMRMVLVAPIAVSLLYGRPTVTVLLFGVAAFTDAVDGFLAKRFGWQSALGGVLDPAADKLLLVTVLIALAYLKLIPRWLTAAAVLRDAVIVGGALAYRCWIGPFAARPSAISKLNTLCQAVFVLAVVAQQAFDTPPPGVTMVLGALVLVTVVISGLDYVLVYGRQAGHAVAVAASSSRSAPS